MAANKLSLTFEGADKDQLVAGLAALVAADCGELTAASMEAIATASGNNLGKGFAESYAKVIGAQEEGVSKFCPKPGAGGGGGGGGGGGAAAAGGDAPKAEEVKEEEEVDFSGGMDMFGGGGGGGDY